MAIDWKALARDRRMWAVAGVGGAAGVGVAVYRRRHGPATPATGTDQAALSSAPYASMQPSVYDSSLQDIYEGFNQTALDLQRQISDIDSQLGQTSPTGPTSPPPPSAARPAPLGGWHGTRIGSQLTLRQLAARYARAPGQPNSVEGTLRQIVTRNPWLTSTPAGQAIRRGGTLRPGQIVIVPTRS